MPIDKLEGTRRPDGTSPHLLAIGEYVKWIDGEFYGRVPNGGLANLAKHKIEEHDDSTITVSPSILVYETRISKEWHGYLVKGVWITA